MEVVKNNKSSQYDFFYDSLGVVRDYLEDDSVTDIMLNPDGCLWLDTFDKGHVFSGHKINSSDAECIIRTAGSLSGDFFDLNKPSIAIELPFGGERFQGVMPPQTKSPVFAIRKKSKRIIPLNNYVDLGVIDNNQLSFLKSAVGKRKNILIAGSTGSGKTTFANSLLQEISKLNTRVAVLEDTCELQCSSSNSYSFKTTSNVDMRQLLKDTLRMNIDSIVVGEIRGSESLDLLKAWSTGHPGGLSTIHANTAQDALFRLEQLVLESVSGCQRDLISRAVDVVVYLKKDASRARKVQEIIKVDGLLETVSPYNFTKF